MLPPRWIDIQEEIDEKLEGIQGKMEELSALRVQRFKPKFDEQENRELDGQVDALVGAITFSIKDCSSKIAQMMCDSSNEKHDEQIRINIQQTYLFRLQEATK